MLLRLFVAAAALCVLAVPARAQEGPSAQECERAWNAVLANNGPASLEQFIEFFASCPQTDEARQNLIALSPDESPDDGPEDGNERSGSVPNGFGAPVDATFVPAGRLLLRGDPMAAEGGGYGVILLRRNGPANLEACQVFVRSLGFSPTPTDGRPELIDGAYVYRRPIYWPSLQTIAATRVSDCQAMLASYDYDRAAVMIARLHATPSAGPLMAVWRADGSAAGLFDYSGLSAGELNRQFDRSLFAFAQSDQIWDAAFYEPQSLQDRLRVLLAGVTAPSKYMVATLVSFRMPQLRLPT